MQHTIHALDGLCRQTRFVAVRLLQVIVKTLNFMSVESFQLDRAERRLDMVVDMLCVVQHSHGLHTSQVLPEPDVEPFTQRHL